MSEFKIGDKVKITAVTEDYKGSLKVGDLAVIECFQDGIKNYAAMVDDNVSIFLWHSVDCFELAPKEVETVTHEGKVYQIGGIYEFSDDGDYWAIDLLASIECAKAYPFKVEDCGWSLIRETESKIGTITPAPIELDHECAYMFDCGASGNIQGIYNKNSNRMMLLNGWSAVENCTNIRPMKVGSE